MTSAIALPWSGAELPNDLVWIPGATYRMGSDRHYREEAPAHQVTVDGFWVSRTTVTNRQFAAFVEATGHVTVAERPLDPAGYPGAAIEDLVPGSMVFTEPPGPVDLRDISGWWAWTPGAAWYRPEGPGSNIEERPDHPVVHVAHEDAAAYASWVGHELPSEAEWELAARGGLDGATFCWGDEATPDGRFLANFWQGDFPWRNTAEDGFEGTAPVGSYPANGFGLFDMAGNVWEWTEDWYRAYHEDDAATACCAAVNPRGAAMAASFDPRQPQISIPRKVVKGGSFLCADNYCHRYRPAARQPQMIDTGMSHLGIRTVRRAQSERP